MSLQIVLLSMWDLMPMRTAEFSCAMCVLSYFSKKIPIRGWYQQPSPVEVGDCPGTFYTDALKLEWLLFIKKWLFTSIVILISLEQASTKWCGRKGQELHCWKWCTAVDIGLGIEAFSSVHQQVCGPPEAEDVGQTERMSPRFQVHLSSHAIDF